MANIKINDINPASSESFISKLEDNELQVLGGCDAVVVHSDGTFHCVPVLQEE